MTTRKRPSDVPFLIVGDGVKDAVFNTERNIVCKCDDFKCLAGDVENVAYRRWKLSPKVDDQSYKAAIKIGRADNNHIMAPVRYVSANHAELRLVALPQNEREHSDESGASQRALSVRVLASNGLGLRLRGDSIAQLISKGSDVPLQNGMTIIMPFMKGWSRYSNWLDYTGCKATVAVTFAKRSVQRRRSSTNGVNGDVPLITKLKAKSKSKSKPTLDTRPPQAVLKNKSKLPDVEAQTNGLTTDKQEVRSCSRLNGSINKRERSRSRESVASGASSTSVVSVEKQPTECYDSPEACSDNGIQPTSAEESEDVGDGKQEADCGRKATLTSAALAQLERPE